MLKYIRTGTVLTVMLEGELDQNSSQVIREELDNLIEDTRIRHLTLDMRALTFMDSSGIGVIIGRYRTLARRGGGVSVTGESDHIRRVMKLTGLYTILENSRGEASSL
jgi:stage II sporulation protein AA (anti-sigma F factor antagonist)